MNAFRTQHQITPVKLVLLYKSKQTKKKSGYYFILHVFKQPNPHSEDAKWLTIAYHSLCLSLSYFRVLRDAVNIYHCKCMFHPLKLA